MTPIASVPTDQSLLPADESRRRFCRHACQVASLGALGALLHGCGGGSSPAGPSGGASAALPVVNGTAGSATITVAIDASSPLATVGALAQVRAGTTTVLVARTGQDAFTALSATCTHENCAINGYSGAVYVCPCHGSQFNTAGQVLNGPARTSLRQYATQFAGNVLTISA